MRAGMSGVIPCFYYVYELFTVLIQIVFYSSKNKDFMKINILKGSIVVILGSMMLFAACKKDDEIPDATKSAKIIGTWEMTFTGLDVNNNGTLEESEKTPRAGLHNEYEYVTFRSDGVFIDNLRISATAGARLYTRSDTSTWFIDGDYITIKSYTESSTINQLDNNNMLLKDISEHLVQWAMFLG